MDGILYIFLVFTFLLEGASSRYRGAENAGREIDGPNGRT